MEDVTTNHHEKNLKTTPSFQSPLENITCSEEENCKKWGDSRQSQWWRTTTDFYVVARGTLIGLEPISHSAENWMLYVLTIAPQSLIFYTQKLPISLYASA
jgi:hypothetical protein